MKRFLLVTLVGVLISISAQSQELGIRFGDNIGGNVAIDGVFAFKKSRVHADVSFGDGLGIDAIYDFIFAQVGQEPFYWYLGAGASLNLGDPFRLGIPGEIGVEYRFVGAPIALGLDARPTFILVEDTDFQFGFGLNIRYVF